MMNKKDVVDALTTIFEKHGIDSIREPQKFKFAIFDLLGGEQYKDERAVLERAVDTDKLWFLLNELPITFQAKKKAAKKLKREKHMRIEEAEFAVQCIAEAYERSIGATYIQKEIGGQNKHIHLFWKKEKNTAAKIGDLDKNNSIKAKKGKKNVKFFDAISLYIYKCAVFVGITIIACITVPDEQALLLGTLTYFPGIIFDLSSLGKNDKVIKDHYRLVLVQRGIKMLLQIWLGICVVLLVWYEEFSLYLEIDSIIHVCVPTSMIAFGISGPLLEMRYNVLFELKKYKKLNKV